MTPYYTCPIKASYMSKYFGMRFVRDFEEPLNPWDTKEISFDGPITCIFQGQKYYIHPSSLSILDITDKDVLEFKSDTEQFVEYSHGSERCDGYEIKIILRNNAPFFWPEVG